MKNKVILSFISSLFFAQVAFSQGQGSITAGGGLLFGSKIESLGLGANGQYFITDNLAGQVGLNFFFPKKESISVVEVKSSVWTINLNANYYFDIANETIRPYALGGINISNATVKTSSDFDGLEEEFGFERSVSDTDFGINLGGGADFYVSEMIIPFAQMKYVISDFDQLVIMGGVRININ